jgi:hypothetical protein
MASLTLRLGATGATGVKNAPLTNAEIDTNFSNINTEVGTKLASSSYTASDVLTKLLTVDGSGSGLDADLLDGLNAVTGATGASIVSRDSTGNFASNQITAAQFVGPLYLGTANTIVFEGSTANDFETTLTVTDPTADRTITFPDLTGTVVVSGAGGAITNDMLAGSIANAKLVNSSITLDGNTVALGGSLTIGAGLKSADNIWTGLQTFIDNKLLFIDNIDNTKALALQLSNITTGTTRTLTIPNADGTIAIGQQVLTSSNVQFANTQLSSLGVGTASSGNAGEIRATGNIFAFYTSDKNLKENIVAIPNALQKVNQIRGVTFDWTDAEITKRGGEDGYFIRKNDVGVIAQEVEAVLPEVVGTNGDGYKAVKYELIIPLLIEAIKELKAEVETLKSK